MKSSKRREGCKCRCIRTTYKQQIQFMTMIRMMIMRHSNNMQRSVQLAGVLTQLLDSFIPCISPMTLGGYTIPTGVEELEETTPAIGLEERKHEKEETFNNR